MDTLHGAIWDCTAAYAAPYLEAWLKFRLKGGFCASNLCTYSFLCVVFWLDLFSGLCGCGQIGFDQWFHSPFNFVAPVGWLADLLSFLSFCYFEFCHKFSPQFHPFSTWPGLIKPECLKTSVWVCWGFEHHHPSVIIMRNVKHNWLLMQW